MPPRKHVYDMDWVDEWQGDRVRPHFCVRHNAEGLRDDLCAEKPPDTFFSSCICWQGQRVARTLESLSSTFLLHIVHARTDVLSGGSTVEQSWSHLDGQTEYAGKRGRHDHKTCAMRSSRQIGRNDGLLIHR